MGRTRTSTDCAPGTSADPQPAQKGSRKQPPADGATSDEGSTAGSEQVSFEQSAERLTQIVEQLEKGDLPLEESLRLFEEGVCVARAAQTRLEQAERRVEELLGLDEQREPITGELDR